MDDVYYKLKKYSLNYQEDLKENEVQKTVKMDEENVQQTIKMGNVIESSPQSYIDVGSVLNGKYKLTKLLTKNSAEAALFLCEANNKKYVAKVFLHSYEPKMEVIEALRTINHPNVIQLLEDGWQNERYYEIMPYFSRGDLLSAVPLKEDYIFNKIVPSVNEALRAIHEKNIIHRDIKPNNIFIAQDGTIVVGDFGISSVLKEGQQIRQTTQQFTPNYAPPESFVTSSSFVSYKFDYYTFGTTLLHLVTNRIPYDGYTDMVELAGAIATQKLPIPETVSERMRTLIRGLTLKEVSNRWGYEEVSRFIAGERVEIIEDNLSQRSLKPYTINGKTASTPKELATILTTEWEEGKKHLSRQLLRKFTKQINNDILSKTIDCEEESNTDLGLFKFILHLNGGEFFSWKGRRYFNLHSLGIEMHEHLPKINQRVIQMISSGALLYYIENYTNNKEFVQRFRQLTNVSKITNEIFYLSFSLTILCLMMH